MSKRRYVSSRREDGNPLRYWHIDELIEQSRDLSVIDVDIYELGELDRVAWYGESAHHGRLTVRQVVEHMKKIMDADLSCPIILSAEGELFDGFHRLAKRFASDPQPCDEKEMPGWLY